MELKPRMLPFSCNMFAYKNTSDIGITSSASAPAEFFGGEISPLQPAAEDRKIANFGRNLQEKLENV